MIDHQDIVSQLVPIVIEQSNRGERSFDIFSRLLRERIIFITGAIEDHMASLVTGMIIVAVLSFFSGLILDTVTRGRREVRRLAYLSHSSPSLLVEGDQPKAGGGAPATRRRTRT